MAPTAHPDAMAPRKPGSTRTAPPQMPATYWSQPRMRTYLLFGATGILYLLVGFVALRVANALAAGPEAWATLQASFAHPIYLLFHGLALAGAIFVGVRFFRLFPKAQPPSIGPAKPPPAPILHAMLYAAWAGVTVVLLVVLGGIWP